MRNRFCRTSRRILLSLVVSGLATAAHASQVRRLRLNPESVAQVQISVKGTILSFPSKPQKVILGRKGAFGLEYIENDIAISPLSMTAQSNLTAYLEGRRYTFQLTASPVGDDIVLIRDSLERSIQVKVK